MPLVAHNDLPAFERLRREGYTVIDPDEAKSASRLHIGLLNLMPDAALQATERQFMRLLGASAGSIIVYVHVFTAAAMPRLGKAREHVDQHYPGFEAIKALGLDALVLTGANPASPELATEPFWDDMVEVIEWSKDNVCSTLCSCLATHAVVKQYHQVERVKLPQKRWGVYSHRVFDRDHFLTRHLNTRFDAPHSHVYEVTREQLDSAGLTVLAVSEQAGVHLAVSADHFQFIYFQGHPEYDFNSLFKEFKREVTRLRPVNAMTTRHFRRTTSARSPSRCSTRIETGCWGPTTRDNCSRSFLSTRSSRCWTTPGQIPVKGCTTTGSSKCSRPEFSLFS